MKLFIKNLLSVILACAVWVVLDESFPGISVVLQLLIWVIVYFAAYWLIGRLLKLL